MKASRPRPGAMAGSTETEQFTTPVKSDQQRALA